MRIVQVMSPEIPSGDGICSHVLGISRALRDRGHDVTIITRRRGRNIEASSMLEGVRILTAPFYRTYPFHVHVHGWFVNKLIAQMESKPDLIHFHSPLVPPIRDVAPSVSTFHTTMVVDTAQAELTGFHAFLMKVMGKTSSFLLEKKLLKISDQLITVSEGGKLELEKYYKCKKDITRIPNFVNTDFYRPNETSCSKKDLLYVGRLSYRKGLFEIVGSAKKVVTECPNAHFTIVGVGPLEGRLKKKVSKLGLGQYFTFCGEITDKQALLEKYQKAYAVLIPSYYEGMPIALLEAMSCGKTIISTTADFSKNLLKHEVNSLLCKPRCAKSLADSAMRLLNDGELADRLAVNARNDALTYYSVDKVVDRIEAVYRSACSRWKGRQRKRVIYNGILPYEHKEVAGEKQLEKKHYKIGLIGRLSLVKGHIYMLRAMKELAQYPDIHLYIFGIGELEEQLRTYCIANELIANVSFMGFCDDIYAYLSQLDLFVMPSLHEGLPFALLYAMKLHIPIVASDVGGLHEILSDREDSRLVPPSNHVRLVEAIMELYNDKNMRSKLTNNAYVKVKEHFLADVMSSRYCEVYEELLNA